MTLKWIARSSQMSVLGTRFCPRQTWVALASLCTFLGFRLSCSLLTPVLSLLATKLDNLKNYPLQVFVLSSLWTNSLCETYSDGQCPCGGLWLALKAKNGWVNSLAFLSSKMGSSQQQLEVEQLLVLSELRWDWLSPEDVAQPLPTQGIDIAGAAKEGWVSCTRFYPECG